MDRMFIGTILTSAINDQGRMLIGQFLNLMTLPGGAHEFTRGIRISFFQEESSQKANS